MAVSDREESSVWDEKTAQKFESKPYSKFFDPCQEAAERSYKCLTRNQGDKDFCKDYFEAYKECKKEWTTKRRELKAEAKAKQGGGWFW